MAGHNKWSKIKHKKAKEDAKKGKAFTKILRELTVAAKVNGADSPRVSLLISKARAVNMPNDLIKRALSKAEDKANTENYDEVAYEGYGPGGVAIVMDALTDNRNRTIAELRHTMGKNGGSMANSGAVLWQFRTAGQLSFSTEETSEDQLLELLLDAGAEDIDASDAEEIYVTCDPNDLVAVRDAAEAGGLTPKSCELTRIPENTIQVSVDDARKILKLVDLLEENDDVQSVYSNLDIPDELANEL